ncbi:MAG: ATP-binding protein [Pyrinomonadaceae bacterium]
MSLSSFSSSGPARYVISVAAVLLLAAVFVGSRDRVNSTTVALSLLLAVLASATFFGRNPALVAAFAAMLCFNFFLLPPYYTWTIADPQNLVAWASFTLTAIIAGELSEFARRRARESRKLYDELQDAFEAAAEAEALRRSEQLKSSLLDAVTHDLQTPLTSIKASVTTLLESEGGHRTIELDSGERAEFLEIIDEETDRLNRFIEGIVRLARVESGGRELPSGPCSIDEAVTTAIQRARPNRTGHEIVLEIPDDLPPVSADPAAAAEVFFNLIDNACKYSSPGSPISISAKRSEKGVAVSVEDRGPGIPAEMRERVFEKFVRIGAGKGGGLGLGLAIAKGIVESQNGTIRIDDGEGGVGTAVTVTFPEATG